MAKFTATVRLLDLEADDKQGARGLLEAKMQAGAVGRYQVVSIDATPSPLPLRQPEPPSRPAWFNSAVGPLLLLGAISWTLWFYWLLFG